MSGLLHYFASRPFIGNVLMFGLIILSVVMWDYIGKEERPEFSVHWLRVSIPYPGASAEDVELFVLKPIEEQLKGISGLRDINNSATFGQASLSITTDPYIDNFREKVQEIKDAVERADLPTETEDPVYDRYNSAEKAIMDIALYLEGAELLTVEQRYKLQEYALTFKNQLLSLPEVSGVETKGYLKPELQIKVDPEKLILYELPLAEVASQIQSQHIRTPLGAMENREESEVALKSFLDDIKPLERTVLRNSFQGAKLTVKDLAEVGRGFERSIAISKIQGHEAVVFNIQKSQSSGILKAREATIELTNKFLKSHAGSPLRIQILDDESYDIRNRLAIIATNGIAGFVTILLILFFFLDLKSGFWVAMGLPFSLAFTLIGCLVLGYTVNNVTLAAVIIVLGIVVDDAIIVADNIDKQKRLGLGSVKAASSGARRVIQPVLAGVLTTCVAFVPLLFFEGRFGMMVTNIPLIVTLMLLASLLESFFILPGHLNKLETRSERKSLPWTQFRQSFMLRMENFYEKWALKLRWLTLASFVLVLLASGWVLTEKLKFVMFPRDNPKEFAVKVIAPEGTTRLETAKLVKKVEKLFVNDHYDAVVGFRTVIAESRRGGQVRENEANLRVELVPPSDQPAPFNEMLDYWEQKASEFPEFEEVRFIESWWSSDSGSPIAIEVRENNDDKRKMISEKLKTEMEKLSSLQNVEIERPIIKDEYTLDLDSSEAMRLNIDPSQLARTMRAYIQGQILYRLYTDEEVDVRLTSQDGAKDQISHILNLRASNNQGYLVPIKQLVDVKKQPKAANIQRINYKRANNVYADLSDNATKTPLDIATYLEDQVFPKLSKLSPSTIFAFRGEIEDSRESQSDFMVAGILVLAFIYIILMFMFSSLIMPIMICAAIPFGIAGVIFAFWAHGLATFGFFALIGAIGMLGVVINDSIIMVDLFEERDHADSKQSDNLTERIAALAKTRLRPVILTTLTTVAGVFPTAYGIGGYDAMLADMMLSMGWGLIFGTSITLFFMPIMYSFIYSARQMVTKEAP